eukprot:TRINITY_DN6827_c0_g1_i4.p1 TRINITY_DN6827_c0_g1~~TRINITY_DN6827_c0_g1_i4.p1  ORF type:complete len:102 (-),score=3.55 TRINITY_DN6827_c0_g1_i4:141-446(-)
MFTASEGSGNVRIIVVAHHPHPRRWLVVLGCGTDLWGDSPWVTQHRACRDIWEHLVMGIQMGPCVRWHLCAATWAELDKEYDVRDGGGCHSPKLTSSRACA